MNYAQLRKYDVANGPAIRVTLFVSGCRHNCPNCFNQEYQKFKFGNELTQDTEDEIISYLKDPVVKGFSLLGGEPLQQPPYTLYRLLRRIKEETNQNIWVWTGYEYENIPKSHLPLLEYIDVLVDGKFIESQKNLKLRFRGSENQRIIDVKETLATGKVKLFME